MPLAILGLATLAASMWGVHELLVLFAAGLVMMVASVAHRFSRSPISAAVPFTLYLPALPEHALAPLINTAAVQFGLGPLFLFFLKVGSVLFGSGYVLIAYLRADLVERWHWLSEAQLLDAVAVGQFTPGPVFTTATFIGYLLGGVPSALIATLEIFLPAFVFVALSAPIVPRLRKSQTASAVLDGINVASLTLMVSATWFLGRSAITGRGTLGLTIGSLFLLVCFQVNSAWLVLGGALIGLMSHGRL